MSILLNESLAQQPQNNLRHLYDLVARKQSEDAIVYFFETCALECDPLLRDIDVDQLDASVLVAILLGTRTRKTDLLSRADFSVRAYARLLELPEERVRSLWEWIG